MNIFLKILTSIVLVALSLPISIGIFFIESEIVKYIPGFDNLLTIVNNFIKNISDERIILISQIIILSFLTCSIISFFQKYTLNIIPRLYCCVCLFQASIFGTEGFAVPAPLIVPILYSLRYSNSVSSMKMLRAALYFFMFSMIFLFFMLVILFFIRLLKKPCKA